MFISGKWKIAVAVLAFVSIIAITSCKKTKFDPFPPSGAVAGWEKSGDTRTFAAKDLWQYIDGAAEEFVKAGVVATSTSDYKFQNQLDAVVDIYTMGNTSGAHTVFVNYQSGSGKSAPLGDEAVAFDQSVTFRKGSNLVRIVSYQSTPDTPQALLALAHGIEQKL